MYNNYVHGNQHWFSEEHDVRNVQSACKKYMNYYVLGQMRDGSQIEGIVEGMDDQGVTMLVPEMVEEEAMNDDRIYGGYGGYGGGYGGGRRRFRRFRRRRFPFAQFVFPFIFPFPFYF